MKHRFLLTILTLAVLNVNAQTYTKVFQPNGNGEETAIFMVDSTCATYSTHPYKTSVDSNSYSKPELGIQTWTSSGCVSFLRTLIRFAAISDTTQIPRHATIASATLTLYDEISSPTGSYGNSTYPSSPYPAPNIGHIYNLATALNAHTATYRNQPAYKHMDSVAIPVSTERFGNDSVVLNITSLVQDLHTNGNNGFLIKLDTENVYRARLFPSSKAPDASKHPKLKVVYSTVGVPEVNVHTTVSVYPNPANNELYVDINGRISGTISVVDQLGKQLLTKNITTSTEKLNISALPTGIYFIRIQNEQEIVTTKFIKQ